MEINIKNIKNKLVIMTIKVIVISQLKSIIRKKYKD